MNNRNFNYDIMPEIKERWSSRAFSDKKINLLASSDINHFFIRFFKAVEQLQAVIHKFLAISTHLAYQEVFSKKSIENK